jgi:hypothetical protein
MVGFEGRCSNSEITSVVKANILQQLELVEKLEQMKKNFLLGFLETGALCPPLIKGTVARDLGFFS